MENKDKIILKGECTGNNDNGCFMESPGHDCGCFKRIQQEEPKQRGEIITVATINKSSNMINKRQYSTIILNTLPILLCVGVIIAFSSPGRDITMWDIMIGIIVSYYSGIIVYKNKNK